MPPEFAVNTGGPIFAAPIQPATLHLNEVLGAKLIRQLVLDAGLPANIDAERTILGAILLDNAAHSEASERLDADDFSLDSHRRIFLRMTELMNEQRAVDIVTLSHELARYKEVEAVGGVAYLVMPLLSANAWIGTAGLVVVYFMFELAVVSVLPLMSELAPEAPATGTNASARRAPAPAKTAAAARAGEPLTVSEPAPANAADAANLVSEALPTQADILRLQRPQILDPFAAAAFALAPAYQLEAIRNATRGTA